MIRLVARATLDLTPATTKTTSLKVSSFTFGEDLTPTVSWRTSSSRAAHLAHCPSAAPHIQCRPRSKARLQSRSTGPATGPRFMATETQPLPPKLPTAIKVLASDQTNSH